MGRAEVLVALALKYGWTSGLELGVFKGHTFCHLLSHVPDLTLIGVDTWEQKQGAKKKSKKTGAITYHDKDMNRIEREARAAIREFGDRATILKMSTVKAAPYIGDASQDFVFVDADHSTAAVMQDITLYQHKVKPTGAIIGHDADWPSVQKALKALGLQTVTLDGNVWFTWKDQNYAPSRLEAVS